MALESRIAAAVECMQEVAAVVVEAVAVGAMPDTAAAPDIE